MKGNWISLALVTLAGTTLFASAPLPGAPQIVTSSEDPALIVRSVQIDPLDAKIRGTIALRFGYSAPLLPHVHVYGLNASGRVISEGCDKLSGAILSASRPAGKAHENFSASLGNLVGVMKIQIVADAGHGNDCKLEDNRILKLF